MNGNGARKKAGRVEKVDLVVKKEAFWVRLFLFADMGFAEAYMLGEVECADLTGFFSVFLPRAFFRMCFNVNGSFSFRTELNYPMQRPLLHPSQRPSLD